MKRVLSKLTFATASIFVLGLVTLSGLVIVSPKKTTYVPTTPQVQSNSPSNNTNITPEVKQAVKPVYATPTKQPLPFLSGSDIFNAINAYRQASGKPGLSVSNELCGIAESRADFMMANNMAAFKSSTVGNHTGFHSDVSYSGAGVGENLGANTASTSQLMNLWRNSPPHNDLMLWTVKDGVNITKGCIATRVSEIGSIVVLEVGDR